MNIDIPNNLCFDLHAAKVGDLVEVRMHWHGSILRLVTKVTPTRLSIQNGGGPGTLRTFYKADGREVGNERAVERCRLVALPPSAYIAVARDILKKQLAEAIHCVPIDASREFSKVCEAARLLDVNPAAFKLPAAY